MSLYILFIVGEHIAAFALTEPSSGSDAGSIRVSLSSYHLWVRTWSAHYSLFFLKQFL
jgi:hypothetical protein